MARSQQPSSTRKTDGGNAAPPVTKPGRAEATDVAARAYELWEQSGHSHGKDQEHWFQAEHELRGRKPAR
jgi:hypothetical protein